MKENQPTITSNNAGQQQSDDQTNAYED